MGFLPLKPSGFPARLRKLFEEGTLHVIISEPILEEIAEVFTRPHIKNKYGISETDVKELLTLIEERAEYVLLSGNITICRDSDDNFIIETAIKGQATFLITRDDDIKFCKEISSFLLPYRIRIISIAKFMDFMDNV
ncbi:MAG: putative toxin-antitoxin system toxin component, PIN family [Planctomycetes bacterium]|nr:putative toxin-antitoxin system toxin component, PIN family [Planctomycetota bacterium]